jgi:hypothetical protein
MSTFENGSADRIQRVAEAVVADASRQSGWYWNAASADEAEETLDSDLSDAVRAEVSAFSAEERHAVLAAILPLIAAEYENQQSIIEDIASSHAEDYTLSELDEILDDEDLTPPVRDVHVLARSIRAKAEKYTAESLQNFTLDPGITMAEAKVYAEALLLRRKLR